jgi:hypothetical protein
VDQCLLGGDSPLPGLIRRRISQLWSRPKISFFDLTQNSKLLIENALDVL